MLYYDIQKKTFTCKQDLKSFISKTFTKKKKKTEENTCIKFKFSIYTK